MNLSKSERILLGLAIILFGIYIGYNEIINNDVDLNFTYKTDVNSINEFENNDDAINKSDENNEKLNVENQDTIQDETSELIDINSATADEISKNLNSIGPKTAINIIEYRNKNGGFKNKEEIKNVKGIGSKKYEKIKDKIYIK